MLKVDIVTRDMHQLHGANRVTEQLICGIKYFSNAGYNLRYVISRDGIINCSEYNVSKLGIHLDSPEYQRKRRLIEGVKTLPIYNTRFVQTKIVEKDIRNNKTVLEYYNEIQDLPDIVIFQDPFTAIYFIENCAQIGRSIFISHADSDPLEQLLMNRPSLQNSKEETSLRVRLENLYKYVNKVVTICTSSKVYMRQHFGIDAACIINGIVDINYSIDKLSTHDKKIHLATVASLHYRKGQDVLIDALSKLDTCRNNSIVLHLVGSGDYEAVLKKKVKDAGLEKSVVFHGAVLNVNAILTQMDGFILCSRADTVPISILEAMRVGLPVFATDVGEISFMIKGCGKIIRPEIDNIASLYIEMLDGSIDFKKMGQLSRARFMQEFNLESMITKYIKVLDDIVSK